MGSFIGIPPLFGFFSKLYLFINLLLLQNNFIIIIFIVVNTFLMIFYLQQLRYLQSNFKKKFFFKCYFKVNWLGLFIIMCLQYINIFSIIFIPFFFNNLLYNIIL